LGIGAASCARGALAAEVAGFGAEGVGGEGLTFLCGGD
jgi:hypothetical protein